MGFNTSVIVLNDALHDIKEDPDFGRNLVSAIQGLDLGRKRSADVMAGSHCNAATVIETHHADMTSVVVFGGNCGQVLGTVLGWSHDLDEPVNKDRFFRALADEMGYCVRRKPARKRNES